MSTGRQQDRPFRLRPRKLLRTIALRLWWQDWDPAIAQHSCPDTLPLPDDLLDSSGHILNIGERLDLVGDMSRHEDRIVYLREELDPELISPPP